MEGKKATEIFNYYIAAGAQLLPFRFFSKECRSFLEAGLKVAKRLNTEIFESKHLLNLGMFHLSQKNNVAAEACLEKAHQMAANLNDAQSEGKILNEIANLHLIKNRPEEAIEALFKKSKLCQENNIEIDEELSLLRLGMAYEKKGEFNKSYPDT